MNTLGMFVKQPTPGKVKTRLAASLGNEAAADVYAGFVRELTDRFRDVGQRRILCHTPNTPDAVAGFQAIAEGDFALWPQPDVPLGERLSAFFDHAFAQGATRVVVIGSDSPTLPRAYIDDAFEQLKSRDTVIGPATDGGYYLFGQTRTNRPVFEDIEWSGPRVLSQTVERIAACRATLALLPVWYDVDSAGDLEFLESHRAALWFADRGPE